MNSRRSRDPPVAKSRFPKTHSARPALVLVPTVQLLGAAVPERYRIVNAAHEDRIVREVEEFGPLEQRRLYQLAFG